MNNIQIGPEGNDQKPQGIEPLQQPNIDATTSTSGDRSNFKLEPSTISGKVLTGLALVGSVPVVLLDGVFSTLTRRETMVISPRGWEAFWENCAKWGDKNHDIIRSNVVGAVAWKVFGGPVGFATGIAFDVAVSQSKSSTKQPPQPPEDKIPELVYVYEDSDRSPRSDSQRSE